MRAATSQSYYTHPCICLLVLCAGSVAPLLAETLLVSSTLLLVLAGGGVIQNAAAGE
jgi:hypothetical protein